MSIEVQGISKSFGGFQALADVSLQVEDGELLALLGPSGSGKTTLLRVLAGLDAPDTGRVRMLGEDVTTTPARLRNIGFVFQHFALFPHLTVLENVAFALRVRKLADADVRGRVEELLALVQLHAFAHRLPAELSGGQRQRVALARALAAKPRLLLLDEPFSALDAKVRRDLRQWLRRLHEELGTTTVFVTHDQEEAFELADRVAVFDHGRIAQLGTPEAVHESPESAFVLDFLGHASLLPGAWLDAAHVRLGGQILAVTASPGLRQLEPAAGDGVTVGIRETDLEVVPADEPAPPGAWPVRIQRTHRAGQRVALELAWQGVSLQARLEAPEARRLQAGTDAHLRIRRAWAFPA